MEFDGNTTEQCSKKVSFAENAQLENIRFYEPLEPKKNEKYPDFLRNPIQNAIRKVKLIRQPANLVYGTLE